jgi:hypothetical protein
MTAVRDDARATGMRLALVNARPGFAKATLVEPPPYGYLLLSAAVEPPAAKGPPRPGRSRAKRALLAELAGQAARLAGQETVRRATVYRAVIVPPAQGYARDYAPRVARYDVVVLIEAVSPDVLPSLERTDAYRILLDALTNAARDTHTLRARCTKSLGDVPKDRSGLYLFNYFAAEDATVAGELWEYLAGWYERNTGLDNSTLLEPLEADDFVFVNRARWNQSLPKVMLDQFRRPSFRSYVLGNLLANRTGSMPILYRTVGDG